MFSVFLAVERQHADFVIKHRFEVDRPFPDAEQVLQRGPSVIQFQFRTVVTMLQKQLASILVVSVADVDQRTSHIGQTKQQLLFDLFKLATLDFVVAGSGRCSRTKTVDAGGRSRASGTRR